MARRLDYNATVSQRIEVAPGLIIIRVVADDKMIKFKPGQYTVLGLKKDVPKVSDSEPDINNNDNDDPDKMILRAYSIASSSVDDEFFEFYITLVHSGELTPRIFNLKPGDRIYIGPKATGMFTLDRVSTNKHLFLIGTGTGLAPYISMVRTLLSEYRDRMFVVVHGASYSWDLGYRNELRSLSRYFPNLKYLPTITCPEADVTWKGMTGWIEDLYNQGVIEEKVGQKITPDAFDVFLCGNPKMVDSMVELLQNAGFTKDEGKKTGSIHIEEYW